MAGTSQQEKRIEAIVISYKEGFTVYHNVKMIRLKGRDINLLIMPDYMPTVGEINGMVEILCEEFSTGYVDSSFLGHSTELGNDEKNAKKCIRLESVSGFFVVKNNVFKLLQKEDSYA